MPVVWAALWATVLLAASACGEEPRRAAELGASAAAASEDPDRPFGPLVRSAAGHRAAFAPGQEVTFMYVALQNLSRESLVIRGIEPDVDRRLRAAARVLSVDLAPQWREPVPKLPASTYWTHPPVRDMREAVPGRQGRAECRTQEIVAAAGFEMPPVRGADDVYLLPVRVRAVSPGRFRLRGLRVTYERAGRLLFQDVPFEIELRVAEGPPLPMPAAERPCAA